MWKIYTRKIKKEWVKNLNNGLNNIDNKNLTLYKPNRNSKLGISIWQEMFSELIQSKELIIRLFIRDISARYKQSVFGILWTIIMPLFSVGTFVYLNYSGVFNVGETSIPYPAYALLGVTVWQLFATGVTACTGSLAGASNLIGKINFAKEALILSSLAQTLFDFIVRVLLIAIVFAMYRIIPSWTIIFLPIALIPLLLLTMGLGFIFSIFNAIVRDTTQVISVAMTFLMFATPVLYPPPTIEPIVTLNKMNPVSSLVIGIRDLVIEGGFTHPNEFMYATIFSLILFLISWRMFHIMEPRIAERV